MIWGALEMSSRVPTDLQNRPRYLLRRIKKRRGKFSFGSEFTRIEFL